MSKNPLHAALEDAIWQALDGEQAMPHSGVDPAYVVDGVLSRLAADGYEIREIP